MPYLESQQHGGEALQLFTVVLIMFLVITTQLLVIMIRYHQVKTTADRLMQTSVLRWFTIVSVSVYRN